MIHVGVIVPVKNGGLWLNECLQSIVDQSVRGKSDVKLSVSIFDDASDDNSMEILLVWQGKFLTYAIDCYINSTSQPSKGVGFARNRAAEMICADYYCFLDCDDVMHPERIEKQLKLCRENAEALVGCQFHRNDNSTPRFTQWCNHLSKEKLSVQVYTSHGPTVAMPTWFLHRSKLLKFVEDGHGTPEDLIYFYAHLDGGGGVLRVDEDLLLYRYHVSNTSFAIKEDTIWQQKLEHFQNRVLIKLGQFSIWGAGKIGKKFYKSLPMNLRHMVVSFFDVDDSKLAHGFVNLPYLPDEKSRWVPVKHVANLTKPFVICLKLDLIGFEEILKQFNFEEGKDFWIFN